MLFLDSHTPHYGVEFLEAAWQLNIVCLILPASLSSRFQPLDVGILDHVKRSCHDTMDHYLIGAHGATVARGMFWRWHQDARAEATTRCRIERAWEKSGLYPLSREVMDAEEEQEVHTPPPPSPTEGPETPRSLHVL